MEGPSCSSVAGWMCLTLSQTQICWLNVAAFRIEGYLVDIVCSSSEIQ